MTLRIRHLALGAFVVLLGTSMVVFPGGSSFDTSAQAHHFWWNFLCDLFDRTAINGESNRVGSLLAAGAMVLVVLGTLLPIWWHAAPGQAGRGSTRVRRGLGVIAAICIITVCTELAMGSNVFHDWATLIGGAIGVIVTLWAAFLAPREKGPVRWFAITGAIGLLATVINIVMYVDVTWSDMKLTPALPTVQKYAGIFMILAFALWPAPEQDDAL